MTISKTLQKRGWHKSPPFWCYHVFFLLLTGTCPNDALSGKSRTTEWHSLRARLIWLSTTTFCLPSAVAFVALVVQKRGTDKKKKRTGGNTQPASWKTRWWTIQKKALSAVWLTASAAEIDPFCKLWALVSLHLVRPGFPAARDTVIRERDYVLAHHQRSPLPSTGALVSPRNRSASLVARWCMIRRLVGWFLFLLGCFFVIVLGSFALSYSGRKDFVYKKNPIR